MSVRCRVVFLLPGVYEKNRNNRKTCSKTEEAKHKERTGPGSKAPVLLATRRDSRSLLELQTQARRRVVPVPIWGRAWAASGSLVLSSTGVRLRHIFPLRNTKKYCWEKECQEGKSNSRWIAAHGKEERGKEPCEDG